MNLINKDIYKNLNLLPVDLQGWNGNSKIFQELIDNTQPQLIIEVGSWKGQSSINMAQHIKSKNIKTKIVCVDTWLGALEFWDELSHTPERNLMCKNGYPQIYYQFLSNVVHYGVENIISPFPNTSNIAAKFFKKKNIKAELIYIDASHEYEDVLDDIRNYFDILNKGGVIFGDDYKTFPGVSKAVDEFAKKNNLSVTIKENNFWIINK